MARSSIVLVSLALLCVLGSSPAHADVLTFGTTIGAPGGTESNGLSWTVTFPASIEWERDFPYQAGGETLDVTIKVPGGSDHTFTNVTVTNGAWSVTATADLADGTYEIVATAKSLLQSTDDGSSNELTVDAVAPQAPVVTTNLSNSKRPTVEGTATLAAGESLDVTIKVPNGGDQAFTNVTVTNGKWSVTATADLADGTYEIVATAKSVLQSTDDGSSNELTVDATPPTVPTVVKQLTKSKTPTISGMVLSDTEYTLTVVVKVISIKMR